MLQLLNKMMDQLLSHERSFHDVSGAIAGEPDLDCKLRDIEQAEELLSSMRWDLRLIRHTIRARQRAEREAA